MEGILNQKILVVDDEEHMLRSLDKTLRSEEAMVLTTEWEAPEEDMGGAAMSPVDLAWNHGCHLQAGNPTQYYEVPETEISTLAGSWAGSRLRHQRHHPVT